MNNRLDPETLKIPAYMRKKAIVSQAKQKLILTALDRKDAGLAPASRKPLAPSRIAPKRRVVLSATPRKSAYPYPATQKKAGLTFGSYLRAPARSITPTFPSYTQEPASLAEPETPTLFPDSAPDSSALDFPQKFELIGEVTHFLTNIDVAIIMLSAPLKIGEKVLIEGDEIIFAQEVSEMQIDRKPVKRAKKGSHIGLKSAFAAKVNGKIFRFSL